MLLRLRPLLPDLSPTHWSYLVVTWFHSGRIRPASGSWGSLAALPVCWAVLTWLGPVGLLVFTCAIFAIGTKAIEHYMTHTDNKDPSEVVIDEVVGVGLYMAFLPHTNWQWIGLGFILFRLFDSIKPGPIGWCDRHIKGALGVMMDDVVASVLTIAALYGFSLL